MNDKIIIDGTNATLGRLASFTAKKALQGFDVIIINSEKVIISGNPKRIIEKYKVLKRKGGSSQKGPKIRREPERLLKRTIRGMIKHKSGKGREAFKKIKCYNKIPKELEEVKKISSGKEKKSRHITLKELSKAIK